MLIGQAPPAVLAVALDLAGDTLALGSDATSAGGGGSGPPSLNDRESDVDDDAVVVVVVDVLRCADNDNDDGNDREDETAMEWSTSGRPNAESLLTFPPPRRPDNDVGETLALGLGLP